MDHFIERILRPYCLLNKINKSLVILDKTRSHDCVLFTDALKTLKANSKYIVIPGGLTGNLTKNLLHLI